MRQLVRLILLVWFFSHSTSVIAKELRASVKYVSASSIYLDKGRDAGIQVGDMVAIIRGSDSIATLEVTYLASGSASCKVLILSVGEIRVGDEAIVEITPQLENLSPKSIDADSSFMQRDTSIVAVVEPRKTLGIVERLKGRASVQVYRQIENNGNNYTEPSLYLQTEAVNIAKTGVNLNIRFRTRQTESSSGGKRWKNRIYEASLRRSVKESKISWGIGRLTFNRAPGIGYIDGGTVEYALTQKVAFGGFLGADPEWGGGNPQWNRIKGGGFVNYQSGDYSSKRRLSTTAAVAGSYQNGRPNREFLYLDNDLSLTNRLSFYQSSEVEINRDWRKTAEGSSMKLSSFMLTGRWTIFNGVSLTCGYDDRTPYRDYDSRNTPDSLFDDALRQGFRAGFSTRLPFGARLSLDGNAGATKGQETSKSSSIMFSQPNFLKTGINGSARFSLFTSAFSEGWQPSISLNRNITRDIDVSLQGGMNKYSFKGSNRGDSTSRWGRLGANYSIGRRLYGSVSFELQKSEDFDTKRIYLDLGARL